MKEMKYSCKECGKTVSVTSDNVPECCGKPMEQMPLDVCTYAFSAEIARPNNEDEPCDDARTGLRK